MHVVVAERPGGPEVLRYEARPDPEPGAGQVRVVTEVAAITFVDTLIRAGSAVAPPATFPVVLGNGVAGTVDAVGDVVVDYRAPGWVEQVRRAAPEGVDVVFDGVSGDLPDLLLPAVRSGGRYVQHGAAAGRWTRIEADRAAAAGVTVVPLAAIGTPEELHRATDEALRLAAEGRLRVTVGQVFPLAEAAAAHAAIGSREALGKTLLRP